MKIDKYIEHAAQLAKEAGRLLLEMRQTAVSVQSKGFRDLVTEADIAAQALIVGKISAAFPNDLIIAEETLSPEIEANNAKGAFYQDPTWIIDPLDGTTNYSRELPLYAVCIGVAWDGVVQVSAVYLPVTDELYKAVKGDGALLNGKPLKLTDPHTLDDAAIAVNWSRDNDIREQTTEIVSKLLPHVRVLRGIGSAAAVIVWIASGRLDLYLNFNMKAWDIAAPGLILMEAGGQITGLNGRLWDIQDSETWVLASNGRIHQETLTLLAS